MKIIKCLAKDIEGNIDEADAKITKAYELKTKHPSEAVWYKDMALAHLNFNLKAHELISSEITAYKALPEYNDHADYVQSMMDVWDDKHNELIAKTACVRAMIDTFK